MVYQLVGDIDGGLACVVACDRHHRLAILDELPDLGRPRGNDAVEIGMEFRVTNLLLRDAYCGSGLVKPCFRSVSGSDSAIQRGSAGAATGG